MGDWREKFRRLIHEAAQDCIDRPIRVVPKGRASGPAVIPPGWHTEEMNVLLPRSLPVCVGCGGSIIGTPKPGPACGPCYGAMPVSHPELPPAA